MSTDIETARQTVCATLLSEFSATPVSLENEKYSPPTNTAWCRASVRHLTSAQTSLGKVTNRRFDYQALLIVQVYIPLDTGLELADQVVEALRSVFQGRRIAGTEIVFGTMTSQEIGPTNDGWFQVNAEVPFNYQEIR
jgi:hypothetical protein